MDENTWILTEKIVMPFERGDLMSNSEILRGADDERNLTLRMGPTDPRALSLPSEITTHPAVRLQFAFLSNVTFGCRRLHHTAPSIKVTAF